MDSKQCYFCTNNVVVIDYKDTETLKKFLNPHARIMNGRQSNVCSLHQRKLTTAIKHARFLALLPFIAA